MNMTRLNQSVIQESPEVQIRSTAYIAEEAFDSQKLHKADLSSPTMASSNSVNCLMRPSSVSRY